MEDVTLARSVRREPPPAAPHRLLGRRRRAWHLGVAIRPRQQRFLRRRPFPRAGAAHVVDAGGQHRRSLDGRCRGQGLSGRHQRLVVGGLGRDWLDDLRVHRRAGAVAPGEDAPVLHHRRLPGIPLRRRHSHGPVDRHLPRGADPARGSVAGGRNDTEARHGDSALGRGAHRRRDHDDLFRRRRTARVGVGQQPAARRHARWFPVGAAGRPPNCRWIGRGRAIHRSLRPSLPSFCTPRVRDRGGCSWC